MRTVPCWGHDWHLLLVEIGFHIDFSRLNRGGEEEEKLDPGSSSLAYATSSVVLFMPALLAVTVEGVLDDVSELLG